MKVNFPSTECLDMNSVVELLPTRSLEFAVEVTCNLPIATRQQLPAGWFGSSGSCLSIGTPDKSQKSEPTIIVAPENNNYLTQTEKIKNIVRQNHKIPS